MKRLFIHIIITLLLVSAAVLCGGCTRELDVRSVEGEGEMIDLEIPFGAPRGTGVTVSTKSTLSLTDESHVFNMYLLIFDGTSSSSKKVYGHYFDGSNLGANSAQNWWEVDNMPSASDPTTTTGTLHIRTAKKGGCTVVAVANMNPDDLDVSPGILSTIGTYGDLNNVVATQVRSEVAANSGYFLMTGELSGVDVLGNTSDPDDISQNILHLRRLYAKVSFEVQVGSAGAAAGIRSFVPDKWYVVNVPTCSYLMERTATPYDDAATNLSSQFFSTPALGFESDTLARNPSNPSNYVYYNDGVTKASCYGFSFYMMENRKAPYARSGDTLPSPFTYADREREIKDGTGLNQGFRYADERSTYIVMTGKIVMGVTSGSNANATLDANVQYKIHLGDFASDNADFNILRNHNYLFKIYINGSDDIKTEVLTGTENEPGATGRVVVAEEEVFNSDCHYSTQVISFHYSLIDPSHISWFVETPFNPEGAGPDEGLELSDIDYKWVEFHVNALGGDGKYSQNRVLYEPHDWEKYDELGIAPGTKGHTMYVNELVEYIKHQKAQYDLHDANPSLPKSDFDSDTDPKITVTAFVNEYYYEEHPTKGGFDPTLWKLVVNHPMRRMHILASSARSADGESDMIGASFTLQQRSIQSIYAVHEVADLQSAWGMEFTDDDNETGASTFVKKNSPAEDCGNTSPTNGRINSLKLWGILNPDGTEKTGDKPRWDDYLNLTGTNETPHLLTDFDYLRYSCLSRNRDNDGDGIIDPEEIRWYMASDIQLIGVFLGSYGIEGDARLYQRNASDQAESNKDKWRQHIIASNRYYFASNPPADALNSNKYPRIVWAEEGVNGSNMSYTGSDQTTVFSTRCVRNLGFYLDSGQKKDITLAEVEVEPDPYVIITRKHREGEVVVNNYSGDYDTNTFYEFDCSHINLTSLRDPVDHELVGHDEFSKMACLSSKFGTAPYVDLIAVGTHTFNGTSYDLKTCSGINNYLDACFPDLDSSFRICPQGYRLPNAREISLMWTVLAPLSTGDAAYLGSDNDSDGTFSRTHWSFGAAGSGKAPTYWGWGMSSKHLLMSLNQKFSKPRCVRDL